MDQESTGTADALEPGQEPAASQGQTPAPVEDKKTFDEAYVKALRKEAAQFRTKFSEAENRLQEIEDRDKTETQKLTDRAADFERRATEAEARLLRFEIAADRGLDARAVEFLTGTTREEIETRADELRALLEENATTALPSSFDGGARHTPDKKQSPEQEHNALLMRAIGRGH